MSERLGYATAVITRETYSRVPQGLQNDAGDRIDAAFLVPKGSYGGQFSWDLVETARTPVEHSKPMLSRVNCTGSLELGRDWVVIVDGNATRLEFLLSR